MRDHGGNLDAARARFGGDNDTAIHDPRLARVGARLLGAGGKRALPWAGVATLLGAPLAAGPEGLDIALSGLPMDLGVTNRPGARFGVRAALRRPG